jgi:two-component system, LuxR family, response regulator FixJ
MILNGVSPTVFIVDDDSDVRESLRALLESFDFKVQDYASGVDFIQHLIPGGLYGCLVLDMHMPAFSGLETLNFLRQEAGITLPVVMITGRSDPRVKARVLAAGASAYLEKPFDGDYFISTIRNLLKVPAPI